jgi:hypothetical protein
VSQVVALIILQAFYLAYFVSSMPYLSSLLNFSEVCSDVILQPMFAVLIEPHKPRSPTADSLQLELDANL